MASIFDRMFQYRQSEGRTPSEDYFTELFAGCLERCESLGTAIAGHLIGRNDITRVEVRTQRSFSVDEVEDQRRCVVDIYVRAWVGPEEHILVIESKIDSGERENQLDDYIELLAAQGADAASRTLAYITVKSGDIDVAELENQNELVNFRRLKWSQVYRWTRKYVQGIEESDSTWKGLLNEFLALMEDWNMAPISADSMRAAISYHNSLNSGIQLIWELIDPAWEESGIYDSFEARGNWIYRRRPYGWQTSPMIAGFGKTRISMGFRFDRRDEQWDVDEVELPSAVVKIVRQGTGRRRFPRPSEEWERGPELGMDKRDLWVLQTNQPPYHGESLEEFYGSFFLGAFEEIRDVLNAE